MELIRLLVLAVICVVAYVVGEALAKAHVPRLPVYLGVGAASGLIITSAVESANLAFPVLNPVTLCIIGFIAGSHLIWEAVKPRIKPIALQVGGMTIAVSFLVTVMVFLVIPDEIPASARLAAAILAGAVMLALSPPEAIAVISEQRSVGPFTALVLGATVVMDVVVVSTFSVAITLAKALIGEGAASASEVAATVGLGLLIAIASGLLVGWLLKALVERVGSDAVIAVIVVVLAALAALLAEVGKGWAHARFGLAVEIESLLVAMIAGLFVANTSKQPRRFAAILEHIAPWVYVVFFTLTGLGLHLETLLAAAVPALFLWALRVAGLFVGSTAAMAIAKEPPVVRRVAWRAFVPQAGIALALAATISTEFPQGGALLASVVVGTVVLNEATGPFFLKSALHATGEAVSGQEVLD